MPYADPAAQREYQRRWMAARRASFTDGKVCEECGSDELIEWHHRDPASKLSHRIWSWSIPRIEAELKKCLTLCSGCHGSLHRAEMKLARLPHGTNSGYAYHGCRCSECREAHTTYNRRLRQR